MSNLMSAVKRLFGGGDDASAKTTTQAAAATQATPVIAVTRPPDAKKDRLKAQEEFKTAMRDGDIPSMEAMLTSRRIAIGDELGGGRGLLQFAVMSNSLKAVKLLVERGASAAKVDSLGASADTLARKSGSPSMAKALLPA